jgi:hypothetical protein
MGDKHAAKCFRGPQTLADALEQPEERRIGMGRGTCNVGVSGL